jgi:hypothetical protein
MTVQVVNQSSDDVIVGGITFSPGSNDIEDETLRLLAKLGLLAAHLVLPLSFDISGMEP